ncbi:MAG TPA: CHAT domain-containing protein, partial [Pyrinomonadaceae bacterium]
SYEEEDAGKMKGIDVDDANDQTEATASTSSSQPHTASSPPQYKRINAWVSERQAEPEKPLTLDKTYHLNFKVGAPIAGSILTAPSANIAESDIPDEGLETTWVVTTESVELAQSEMDKSVKVEQTNSPAGWKAEFTLFIPKNGSSKKRQLLITPHQADEAEINIFIFARNTLYRQFRVKLSVAPKQEAPPEEKKSSVAIIAEVIHMPAMHTGLQPQHEWQTPPGKLDIVVQDAKTVYVLGMTHGGEVNAPTNWNANDKQVSSKIESIRDSAENFRTEFSKQLNDIEPQDLEARLAAFRSKPWERWSDNESLQVCDAAHQQGWEKEVAASQQLYELAYHGYKLYETFFPDKSSFPLRGWLDSLLPGWRINISWPAEMNDNWIPSVPWGLLYTQPVTPNQPIDPMNFWGLRFRLGYFAHAIDNPKPPSLGTLEEIKHAYGFYWGDEIEIAEEVARQKSEWTNWHSKIFVPDTTLTTAPKDQLVELLCKPGQTPPSAFYFFCHCSVGNGNKPVLRFGNTDDDADNLRPIDWGTASFTNQPVVFINACTSASSDPYLVNELEETFFSQGCRAYLGTEIKVPIRLASRFAKIFYSYFYRTMDDEARPIAAGEAVFQARRFLWREYRNLGGLFYTYINTFNLYMASKEEVDALHIHQ